MESDTDSVRSEGSSSTESFFSDAEINATMGTGVEPYILEPSPSESDDSQDVSEQEDQAERTETLDWDLCGLCKFWPDRQSENNCCMETPEIAAKASAASVECITVHPGFEAVCLNEYVLEVAWLQYKQQYGRSAHEGPHHQKMRHVAYRQFVRFCYGTLGRDIRVALPSCVYRKVRERFPPPAVPAVYRGFLFGDESE